MLCPDHMLNIVDLILVKMKRKGFLLGICGMSLIGIRIGDVFHML